MWAELARDAGTTPFALMGTLGAMIERDEDHRQVWQRLGVAVPVSALPITSVDLYTDAVGCRLSAVGKRRGPLGLWSASRATSHQRRDSAEFQRLAKAAGLPKIRLHDVRHTSVSLMMSRAIPVLDVAKWHGHDPAMTLRVYGHVFDESLAAAGASLFGIVAGES